MNAVELFVLGRKLMKLAEQALPAGGLAPSVRSVLIDVAAHPGSSISAITTRTGFPQSHVSGAVARLRELGAVQTEPDPLDRRRTLVRVTPAAIRRAAKRAPTPVDQVLIAAMGSDEPAQLGAVVEALDLLARRLTPKALARIRAEMVSP
jgi:DNA-binding MarR family transcriptional regulator